MGSSVGSHGPPAGKPGLSEGRLSNRASVTVYETLVPLPRAARGAMVALVGAEVGTVADGVLTVKITGTLAKSELEQAQASTRELLRAHGKLRLLVIATDFLGWEKEDWSDVSSPASHDRQIEKMAIVGDRRWEDLVLAFTGKGYRPVAIEYFGSADVARARAWLGTTHRGGGG